VHCGLGIGLAAGKCCAERISEQGGDVGLERTEDVTAKTVARSASINPNPHNKRSQRKHHPSQAESKQVTRNFLTHIPIPSLKLCKCLVELQRSDQLPRACLADAVRNKAAQTFRCKHDLAANWAIARLTRTNIIFTLDHIPNPQISLTSASSASC
jgi:hypothetical protein